MKKEEPYLCLERIEASHILWTHEEISVVDDGEREDINQLVTEVDKAFRQSVEYDYAEVKILNYPRSREFLLRRILQPLKIVDTDITNDNPPTPTA